MLGMAKVPISRLLLALLALCWLNASVITRKVFETTTTTLYTTAMATVLTGTFAVTYNELTIVNKPGKPPNYLISNYQRLESYSDTWTTFTITTTTTTIIGTDCSAGPP